MRLKPWTLGAFFCACAGGGAVAQSMPQVAMERQIHGSLSVSGIYESNFARSNKATADARGIKPEEWILRPQANINVVQPFGRQVVFAVGSAGYDFHRENPQLDRRRYDVQGGYMTSLGMCQLAVVETFGAAQSDLATLDSVGTTKNEVRATGTSVVGSCARGTGLGVAATVSRIDTKNSATVQKPADSTLENLGIQVSYANPTLGRFGVVYAYASSELPNRILPGRPVGDGFFTQSLGLSAERDVGSRLTLAARVARTQLKREFAPAGAPQKFTSTTYSGDVTYRVGSRFTLNATAERAMKPTARSGKLYDITTSGQVTGRYQLGTRYTVSLGYGLTDVESNVDTIGLQPVVTDSQTESVFGSIRYQQNERAGISLDVRHDDRSTNLAQFNYSSTRVALTAQVGF